MIAPLAERLRPKSLEEIVGQDQAVGPNGFITSLIKRKQPVSIILWGPPGCGKTSIARLYAQAFSMPFESLNPAFSGIADIKKLMKESADQPLLRSSILLFVDEIHRFNKAQQDVFLPYLENGKIVLVGATIENPSFYLNGALLSRTRVIKLNALNDEALEQLIQRYEKYKKPLSFTPEARLHLINLAQGDGRYLFNLLENLEGVPSKEMPFDLKDLELFFQKRAALFDREGDQHYNLISALHKSVRGSDPDASLYWLSRILAGGEDPLFVARRCIRMASEDVGLADPQALILAIAARDTYQMLGSPEGELALAQIVVYLALAPKSNALYTAFNASKNVAEKTTHLDPPKIILNAPTKLMEKLDYGQGYIYDHDTPEGFSGQDYFPGELVEREFYHPVDRGFEREMKKRLLYFKRKKTRINPF